MYKKKEPEASLQVEMEKTKFEVETTHDIVRKGPTSWGGGNPMLKSKKSSLGEKNPCWGRKYSSWSAQRGTNGSKRGVFSSPKAQPLIKRLCEPWPPPNHHMPPTLEKNRAKKLTALFWYLLALSLHTPGQLFALMPKQLLKMTYLVINSQWLKLNPKLAIFKNIYFFVFLTDFQ